MPPPLRGQARKWSRWGRGQEPTNGGRNGRTTGVGVGNASSQASVERIEPNVTRDVIGREEEVTYETERNLDSRITPTKRPQGLKVTKRTLSDRLEDQKRQKFLGDIRHEMKRVNDRADKAFEEQRVNDRVMRLHTLLRFLRPDSKEFDKYTKELCDLHEEQNRTNERE